MKRILSLTCLVLSLGAVAFAQVNTKKDHLIVSSSFFAKVSTTMTSIDKYLDGRAETHKNLTLGALGFSFEGDCFIIDNLAYHIQLSPYQGTQLTELRNKDNSIIGLNSILGLEYYISLSGKNKLSLGSGIGNELFGYFNDSHTALYSNYYIPITVTFWLNRMGVSLFYEPCISKGNPRNNASMLPKMSPNFVGVSFRYK